MPDFGQVPQQDAGIVGVAGGGRGEVAGQVRVDRPDASNSPDWRRPDLRVERAFVFN